MRYSKLLNTNIRREFDPSRYEDQVELKYFVEHGKWRTACPFFAEYPWEDIPAMCLEKFTKYALSDIE